MGLAERDPRAMRPGKPCSVGKLLRELPPEDRATLAEWLASPDMTERGIWTALIDEGHDCGRQTIGRHRRRECHCGAS
jgi:hypothetical protein